MTVSLTGVTSLVYDGSNNPNILYHQVSNLASGNAYTFNLVAINFNGVGPKSNDAVFTACTPPSVLALPVASDTTTTTALITWTAPLSTGGCPITGY